MLAIGKKKSYEDVCKLYNDNGLKILDSKYINSKTKMNCINKEGYMFSVSYDSLIHRRIPSIFGNGNPYTIENIVHHILKNRDNIVLIKGQKWVGTHEKLIFKCLIHNEEFAMTWGHFKQGQGCPLCGGTNRLSISDILQIIKKDSRYDKVELVLGQEYINNNETLRFKCKIHNEMFEMCWGNFSQGQGCPACGIEKRSGENNYNYNPNLTQEERETGRNFPKYKQFVRDSLKLADYTCDITGERGHKLQVHHLNSYHWDVENRTNIQNSVVLTEEIHMEFHNMYGRKNNTKNQYVEFKNLKLQNKHNSTS